MHFEILVEDSSGQELLDLLLPEILGTEGIQGQPHTWRIHSYKGLGRVPPDLRCTTDAGKRVCWTGCLGFSLATHRVFPSPRQR